LEPAIEPLLFHFQCSGHTRLLIRLQESLGLVFGLSELAANFRNETLVELPLGGCPALSCLEIEAIHFRENGLRQIRGKEWVAAGDLERYQIELRRRGRRNHSLNCLDRRITSKRWTLRGDS